MWRHWKIKIIKNYFIIKRPLLPRGCGKCIQKCLRYSNNIFEVIKWCSLIGFIQNHSRSIEPKKSWKSTRMALFIGWSETILRRKFLVPTMKIIGKTISPWMAKPAITVPIYNPNLRNVSSTSVIVIIFEAIKKIIPIGAYLNNKITSLISELLGLFRRPKKTHYTEPYFVLKKIYLPNNNINQFHDGFVDTTKKGLETSALSSIFNSSNCQCKTNWENQNSKNISTRVDPSRFQTKMIIYDSQSY